MYSAFTHTWLAQMSSTVRGDQSSVLATILGGGHHESAGKVKLYAVNIRTPFATKTLRCRQLRTPHTLLWHWRTLQDKLCTHEQSPIAHPSLDMQHASLQKSGEVVLPNFEAKAAPGVCFARMSIATSTVWRQPAAKTSRLSRGMLVAKLSTAHPGCTHRFGLAAAAQRRRSLPLLRAAWAASCAARPPAPKLQPPSPYWQLSAILDEIGASEGMQWIVLQQRLQRGVRGAPGVSTVFLAEVAWLGLLRQSCPHQRQFDANTLHFHYCCCSHWQNSCCPQTPTCQ